MNKKNFKSGFVGIVGRTNVGKSTIINKILRQKAVITSDKVQTTRNRINCILNNENSQIIFVDSPGFFKPKSLLGERLNSTAIRISEDVDIQVAVADAAGGIGSGDFYFFKGLEDLPQPKILLLNKMDLVSAEKIEKEKQKLQGYDLFDRIIGVSAKTGENLDDFLNILYGYLPEGPMYFDRDMVTDRPLEKIIEDLVREKLLENLSAEVPHSITVEVERFEEKTTRRNVNIIFIGCSIYTERTSQKSILIGKSGSMLKKVGSEARIELESLLQTKVFLELWVKVKKNWTGNEDQIKRFGY